MHAPSQKQHRRRHPGCKVSFSRCTTLNQQNRNKSTTFSCGFYDLTTLSQDKSPFKLYMHAFRQKRIVIYHLSSNTTKFRFCNLPFKQLLQSRPYQQKPMCSANQVVNVRFSNSPHSEVTVSTATQQLPQPHRAGQTPTTPATHSNPFLRPFPGNQPGLYLDRHFGTDLLYPSVHRSTPPSSRPRK